MSAMHTCKVLAVASGGGHWIQLLRLRPAFKNANVVWVSTNAEYAKDIDGSLYVVEDANRWKKWAVAKMFCQIAWLLLRLRPDVVVTTGAAPGLAAVIFGRILRARTVWIDSIANSEELSLSGSKAGKWANVWLTQWEHLARPEGPHFWGGVL